LSVSLLDPILSNLCATHQPLILQTVEKLYAKKIGIKYII